MSYQADSSFSISYPASIEEPGLPIPGQWGEVVDVYTIDHADGRRTAWGATWDGCYDATAPYENLQSAGVRGEITWVESGEPTITWRVLLTDTGVHRLNGRVTVAWETVIECDPNLPISTYTGLPYVMTSYVGETLEGVTALNERDQLIARFPDGRWVYADYTWKDASAR